MSVQHTLLTTWRTQASQSGLPAHDQDARRIVWAVARHLRADCRIILEENAGYTLAWFITGE